MVLTLFLVTFTSALVLGVVQKITEEPIAIAKINAQNEAIRAILPDFSKVGDSFFISAGESEDSLEVFKAFDESENLVGVAINSFSKNGFGGKILVMVGFDTSGAITGYQVLEHKETPGLGSKMSEWFNNKEKSNQNIIGKNPSSTKLQVSKDGGEIDGITASTITSRAFLEAINLAFQAGGLGDADGVTSQTKKTVE